MLFEWSSTLDFSIRVGSTMIVGDKVRYVDGCDAVGVNGDEVPLERKVKSNWKYVRLIWRGHIHV